jgi:hypothetical protein
MNKLKNAVIFGVGRCGSHWVESIMIDLLGGIGRSNNNVQLMPHGWILHTHELIELTKFPKEVRESTMLILCSRENKFDQSISYHVAQKTNEWFVYSDEQIAPFTIDPVAFEGTLTSVLTHSYPDDLLTLWPNLINIKYEDLADSEIPEKYVAKCLGIKYKKTQGWSQQGSRKNPRNYQNLVLNWNELVAISKKYVA